MSAQKVKTEILKKLQEKFYQLGYAKINDGTFRINKNSNSSYYTRPSYLKNLYLSKEEFDKWYKTYFDNGNGKELLKRKKWGNICKMQSLGSSSAMIVNLIATGDREIDIQKNDLGIPSGKYQVSFERKFRILKTSYGKKYPPNVDGFLLSKDQSAAILIETKMLEYICEKKQHEIKKPYLCTDNYYDGCEEFAECFNHAKNDSKLNKSNLDYPQLIKHIAGFYSALTHPENCFKCYENNNEVLSNVKKVYLLNVVWHINKNCNISFYNEYEKYWQNEIVGETKLNQIKVSLPKTSLDIDIKFVPFEKFIEIIKYDSKHRQYLNRYFLD